jgi:hypothetical protein
MKRNILLSGIFTVLILGSCQKLDQEVITTLNYDQVTKSYEFTKQRCAGLYNSVMNGFNPMANDAMMAVITDEAEHNLETASAQKFNNGAVNAYDNPDNVWSGYFQGIRRVNSFLASTDSVNLDLYKFDPSAGAQTTYRTRLAEIKNWKYEGRFLRAYFYFELVKRYGGVPIITTAGTINDDFSKYTRNSLAECIEFIVDECDSAASVLPVKYAVAADHGRATKGAALALKSRMLLYAASDLFNDPSWAGGYSHPELIAVTGNRTEKWQAAANAAKAVIDLATYSLATNYGTLFGSSTFTNNEVIFCRRNGNSNTFEKANIPIGYQLGSGRTNPSQNLVDAYEVKVNSTTAVPFDWNNPAHAANPYATTGSTARDPRLAFTILTNNTTLKGRPVESFIGGLDGKPKDQATKTGYYLKKQVDTGLDLVLGQSSNHAWIIFRLAEIYLNYAEALNEVSPGHADIKTYVDNVRKRNTVAMPLLPSGLTQDQMREKIRHERRIELAFEDHRYWDLKRWNIAPEVLSAPLKGIEITKNADLTFSYKLVEVETRIFGKKLNFYPIPQSELFITKWPQNPLW